MKMMRGSSDEPEHRQSREIVRNCGQLLGRLDDILPFLYIAQAVPSDRDLRERTTEEATGLFAVSERWHGSPSDLFTSVGLILPLRLCSDEQMRAALLDIPALVNRLPDVTMSDRRRLVQTRLDEAFGDDLMVSAKESLDGFFALVPGPGLFHRLVESFAYVTEVVDNPAGVVRVTGTSRFDWHSYGELMEWHYGVRVAGDFVAWYPLIPFFVCGNTGSIYSYCADRWARKGLHTPAEDPSKWFVIRPGLPNAQLGIRFEMRDAGWAKLHMVLDNATATIHLSEVFDPFSDIVAWGREIDEGDLPIEMEIDEEGREAVLTVLCTEDPARVLLRVARKDEDRILLEGIVARAALAAALKAELRRFFTVEFNPQEWDMRSYDDRENDFIQTKDRVLGHAWLAW